MEENAERNNENFLKIKVENVDEQSTKLKKLLKI